MANSKKKLSTVVYVDNQPYGPDDDVPADVAKQITNPAAWEGGSAPDEDVVSAAAYDGMTKKELQAEIAKRNEGRDEAAQIKPESDKNGDLARALTADDVGNAGA